MRLAPLKMGNVVETNQSVVLPPSVAGAQARKWDEEFWQFMRLRGVHPWDCWDALPAAAKYRLMEIYEQGFDNVTRRKLGLTELTEWEDQT